MRSARTTFGLFLLACWGGCAVGSGAAAPSAGAVLTPAIVDRLVAAARVEHAAMLRREGRVQRFGLILQRDGDIGTAGMDGGGNAPSTDWVLNLLELADLSVGADVSYAGEGRQAGAMLVWCCDREGREQRVPAALPQPVEIQRNSDR